MKSFKTVQEMELFIGEELGTSDWLTVDQASIQKFADATGDHQWIHVDVERAKRESPLGGPVAHGFMSLAMLPRLMSEVFRVEAATATINYGLNKVRFTMPVAAGARIRGHVRLDSIERRGDGQTMVSSHVTIELEGRDKPACVADCLTLFLI